jgi:hypothetical protein
MNLTRAQIVGLFGVATDLPIDTAFSLEPPDHYDNIIVSARSEHTDLEVRYKLFVRGRAGTTACTRP